MHFAHRGMLCTMQFAAHRLGGRLGLCVVKGYASSEDYVTRRSTACAYNGKLLKSE
jgi:hypothetical protein